MKPAVLAALAALVVPAGLTACASSGTKSSSAFVVDGTQVGYGTSNVLVDGRAQTLFTFNPPVADFARKVALAKRAVARDGKCAWVDLPLATVKAMTLRQTTRNASLFLVGLTTCRAASGRGGQTACRTVSRQPYKVSCRKA